MAKCRNQTNPFYKNDHDNYENFRNLVLHSRLGVLIIGITVPHYATVLTLS